MEKELTHFGLDIWEQVSPILSVLIVIAIFFIAFKLFNKLMDKLD